MINAFLSSLSNFLSKKVNHHSLNTYHVPDAFFILSHVITTLSSRCFIDKESEAQRD